MAKIISMWRGENINGSVSGAGISKRGEKAAKKKKRQKSVKIMASAMAGSYLVASIRRNGENKASIARAREEA